MDFILNAVSGVISAMSAVLGSWSFTRNLASDLNAVSEWLQRANAIMPIGAMLTVLSLYLTVQLALVAYYWVTRMINLLRGAG